jgi:glutathione synthase/RimK-type ligase-like ATP-grasp enzyme
LDADDRPLVAALGALEIEAAPVVWDDPAVDWDSYALVVLRSTWDYAERHVEFLEWAKALSAVVNPVSVLEWNTDKERYLTDLEAGGIPVVPTRFVAPGGALDPLDEPFVVKPAVSAGGRSSARFDPSETDAARALVARIHAEGRVAIVQPYVDAEETGLVFVGGEYSHAVRRHVPLPASSARSILYLDEDLSPATATSAEQQLAGAAIACAPDSVLYGRVDLLGGAVLELELTEPSLYLSFGDGAADRLARAISRHLATLR